MKKNIKYWLFIGAIISSTCGITQQQQEMYFTKVQAPLALLPYKSQKHTKAERVSAEPAIPLKGVTAGFSIGYNYLFNSPKEYYLSTDGQYNLNIDKRGKSNFVVSTVVSFRLGKPAIQKQTKNGKSHIKIVDLNSVDETTSEQIANTMKAEGNTAEPVKYYKQTKKSNWTLNIGLNLVDISSDVTFNKSIDGGIGLGYMINDFAQIALFFDVIKYRQLRNNIVMNYEGKPIPNGSDVYTALDEKDNNLYTNKAFPGMSFKLILTMNNQ